MLTPAFLVFCGILLIGILCYFSLRHEKPSYNCVVNSYSTYSTMPSRSSQRDYGKASSDVHLTLRPRKPVPKPKKRDDTFDLPPEFVFTPQTKAPPPKVQIKEQGGFKYSPRNLP